MCIRDRLTPGYVADIPGMDGAYVSAIGDNGRLLAVQYCRPVRYDGKVGLDTLLTPYLLDAGGNRIDTVSYTHLDVYKRQVISAAMEPSSSS